MLPTRSTLEVLTGHRTTDSDVLVIETWRTSTAYCPNHWQMVFRHPSGYSTIASIVKKPDNPDTIEWTRAVVPCPSEPLPSSDMVRFEVTYKCPGIQDLATAISLLEDEHTGFSASAPCYCSQWA